MHTVAGWAEGAAITTPSFAKTPPMRLRGSARARFAVRLSTRTHEHLEIRCTFSRTTFRNAVALALDAQIMDAVPIDTASAYGDELVDVVLTPTRVIGPSAAEWK